MSDTPPQRRDRAQRRRFDIAIEHAAWRGAWGDSPAAVILSVGQLPPSPASWSDAVYALVYAQIALDRAAGEKAKAAL